MVEKKRRRRSGEREGAPGVKAASFLCIYVEYYTYLCSEVKATTRGVGDE
jgi:hypothetical protein